MGQLVLRTLTVAMIVLVAMPTLSNGRLPAQTLTVELEVNGRRIEASPLAWSERRVMMLGRDGYLWDVQPQAVTNYRKTSDTFRGYSAAFMRGRLMQEFGRHYGVSGTGHYLVVHPSGQRDLWAARFEQLYRAFVHYFSSRGVQIRAPEFPLVAVVLPDQRTFLNHLAQNGYTPDPKLRGYYSDITNRIYLYDSAGQRNHSSAGWQENAITIVHEAAHQMAFNTGVHSRTASPPRWLAEGLATLYEAPGVWDSSRSGQWRERVNVHMHGSLMKLAAQRRTGWVAELVSSDRLFQSDPQAAYTYSWALTFFLVERMPRQYQQLLQATAARDPFTRYTAADRLREFRAIVGEDLVMFETRLLRDAERW